MILVPSVSPAHRADPLSAAKTVTYRMTPTAFIIDEDPDARKSLRRLLRAERIPVETYASPRAFLARFEAGRPGCVICDARMSGMNGWDLQDRLRAAGSDIPVLLLTGAGDVRTAVRAVKAGAFDVFEKPDAARFLPDAVRQALASESSRLAERQEIRRKFASLSEREQQVAALLIEGKTTAEIAARLDISRKTAEAHRANALRKLDARNVAQLVRMSLHGRSRLSASGHAGARHEAEGG